MSERLRVLILDAQGGGLGARLITRIKSDLPEVFITAVGTNAAATMNMLKAGAEKAATGENAVTVACRDCDVILGPLSILVADSMYGEVTERMAIGIGRSKAKKILLPFDNSNTVIVGQQPLTTGELVELAKSMVEDIDAERSSSEDRE